MNFGMILILICVFLGVSAQLLLKTGVNDSGFEITESETILNKLMNAVFTPTIFLGFILYGFAALSWLIVLSKFELSYAYPMLALMYAIIPLVATIVLHEHINAMQGLGIGIVVIGVLIVSQSGSQI